MIEVKESKYGRGIFATRDIHNGELIHEAPVIVSPGKDYKYLTKTIMRDYVFWWDQDNDEVALALGYGSLFNHSYRPNAIYGLNFANRTIDFYAHIDIKAGEEILINYNGEPDDDESLWFDVI
ncbi:SET domain-containing protein [Neobacillus sp. GCM10023253]|uniref:SET domain-containing protein n=1 Tax=Neobacillus sp. GCM10023253 TaxID=3252644 RepID=UPI003619C99D